MSFNVILADPPWRYSFSRSRSRRVENHYPTMTVDEIARFEFPRAASSVLYLWATAPKLPEALAVMSAWGYNYKSHAVWDKERMGMGYWFRGQHELLLVGTQGPDIHPPQARDRWSSVFRVRRGRHSEKPGVIYEMIEQAYPQHAKLELFARRPRPGWMVMGNEVSA
ncbi:MAG: MT-A70 family methyltransferase [Acidobacteria bacterium]|nr:MT-A70 family methyltransferase [Acidobacteriota bacterium]